jgi:DNA-nicking Smr family endonuclease
MGRRRPTPLTGAEPDLGDRLRFAIPDAEVDLHGMTSSRARGVARNFLCTEQRKKKGAVVRIITGRGAHSAGEPTLRPLVQSLLAGGTLDMAVSRWDWATDGGSCIVELR